MVESAHEALEKVASWLRDENGVVIDDSGHVTVEGEPPIEVRLTADEDRVVITHVTEEPGAGASRADAIIAAFPDRGTTLHAAANVDRTGMRLTITNHVYIDGLTRQTFMTALNDLVAAVDGIGRGTTAAETKVQEAVAITVPDPGASSQAAQAAPDQSATSQATSATWRPTHRVPSGGMRAWADPDPAQQPVTRLEPRVELAIVEQRGDWSRVIGSNGWTGWVDARRLVAIDGAKTAAAAATGTPQIQPLVVLGGIALIVAAFLPWVSIFTSVSSMDVAVSFLWSLSASGAPYLGWLLIALGVIALGLGTIGSKSPGPALATGIAAVVVPAAFIVQMYRGISQTGGAFSDVFSWVGVGPWIALVAGILVAAGATKVTAPGRG